MQDILHLILYLMIPSINYYSLALKINYVSYVFIWNMETMSICAKGETGAELSYPMEWQPNGRHLYISGKEEGKQKILLFEKNGYPHAKQDLIINGTILLLINSNVE